MATIQIFHGRPIIHPGVYVFVDVEAFESLPSEVFGKIAVVGEAIDGIPKEITVWTDISKAKLHFRGGDLLEGLAILEDYSVNPPSVPPAYVIAVRVNQGQRASLNVFNSYTIYSRFYSSEGNKIKVKVVALNPVAGDIGSKVEVSVKYGSINETRQVGERLIKIENQTGGDIVVQITKTTFEITDVNNNTLLDINYDRDQIRTLGELVNRINQVQGVVASLLWFNADERISVMNTGNATIPDSGERVIWNNVSEEIKFFSSIPVLAVEEGTREAHPDVQETNLSGGASQSATLGDWDEVIAKLEQIDVDFVIPLSTSDSVINKFIASTVRCNDIRKKAFRELIVGIDTKNTYTTLSQIISRVRAINNPRVRVVAQRILRFNSSGILSEFPEWALALEIAGIKGTEVGIPLTFKRPKVVDVVRNIDWGDLDIQEQLILGGVLAIEPTTDGWRIIKGITSYTGSDNLALRLDEAQTEIVFISKTISKGLTPFIGRRNDAINLQLIRSSLIRLLEGLQNQRVIVSSLGRDGTVIPAFRNIKVEQEGDVIRISFECTLSVGINFIFVDVYAFPPGVS